MQSTTLEAACLGKLPTHGDFIRHRASTPTMRTFDEWMRTGLHQIRQHCGEMWDHTHDNTPTIRFLFSDHSRQAPNALLGVLRGSHDRKGRAYPFAVTCELRKSDLRSDYLAYLPLQAKRFYTAAEHIVQNAMDGAIPYREVADHVARIEPEFSLNASPPLEYERYTQQTLEAFLESLFEHFKESRKYEFFGSLLDILLPQRDRTSPRLNYGLQFPLGDDEDRLTITACFWLDISRRLLDHPEAEFSFFWTPQTLNDKSSFLLLFLGSPRAEAFFHRLTSDEEVETIYRLKHAETDSEAKLDLSIPEEYGTLLDNNQLSLQAFLRRL